MLRVLGWSVFGYGLQSVLRAAHSVCFRGWCCIEDDAGEKRRGEAWGIMFTTVVGVS